jgi:hypothetical protein
VFWKIAASGVKTRGFVSPMRRVCSVAWQPPLRHAASTLVVLVLSFTVPGYAEVCVRETLAVGAQRIKGQQHGRSHLG